MGFWVFEIWIWDFTTFEIGILDFALFEIGIWDFRNIEQNWDWDFRSFEIRIGDFKSFEIGIWGLQSPLLQSPKYAMICILGLCKRRIWNSQLVSISSYLIAWNFKFQFWSVFIKSQIPISKWSKSQIPISGMKSKIQFSNLLGTLFVDLYVIRILSSLDGRDSVWCTIILLTDISLTAERIFSRILPTL